MPLVGAAAITAGAAIFGAAKTSRAATKAAKTQADAATEAARLEDEATKRAETFAREQSQATWAESEAVRKANYDQWASRQTALNALRQKYGYGEVPVPAYVPSTNPGFTGGPTGPAVPPGGTQGEQGPPSLETWRTQPVRDQPRPGPMAGEVGSYLPSQRTAFQPYGEAPLSVGSLLRRRSR